MVTFRDNLSIGIIANKPEPAWTINPKNMGEPDNL